MCFVSAAPVDSRLFSDEAFDTSLTFVFRKGGKNSATMGMSILIYFHT